MAPVDAISPVYRFGNFDLTELTNIAYMLTYITYTVIAIIVLVPAAYKGWKMYKQTKHYYRDTLNLKEKTILNPTQQWIIAAGANLASINGNFLNALETGQTVEEIKKDVLKQDWGIENKQSALETIEWMQTDGHRVYFEAVKEVLRQPETERIKLLQQYSQEAGRDMTAYFENTVKGLRRLKDDGIVKDNLYFLSELKIDVLAWDYGRLINVCRWCYVAKFITEAEAWNLMFPAAQALQQTYSSWEEMSAAYLVGRYMWGGEDPHYGSLNYWHKMLLEDPKSPWKTLDWNQPLSA
jgi:Protein of unknown function (DUF1266)